MLALSVGDCLGENWFGENGDMKKKGTGEQKTRQNQKEQNK